MTEDELEEWMAGQREKRRLKLIRRAAEASIAKGSKRTLVDPHVLIDLLDQLGAPLP